MTKVQLVLLQDIQTLAPSVYAHLTTLQDSQNYVYVQILDKTETEIMMIALSGFAFSFYEDNNGQVQLMGSLEMDILKATIEEINKALNAEDPYGNNILDYMKLHTQFRNNIVALKNLL